MIEALPMYISLAFGLTTIATLLLLAWVVKNAYTPKTRKKTTLILIGMIIWLMIQAILTMNNVYNTNTDSLPPKIVIFGILPTILTLIFLFATQHGRVFMDSLPLRNLTYLNIVRVPVEMVLFWLFVHKAIPELMTFEGRNFDIIAGITAPFVAYFGLTKAKLSRAVVLVWNVICLGLLLNIVVNAFLSAPSPIQRFAFDQPNVAISYFPFSWLPTFVVPIVLFGHLASIRQLSKPKH